MHAWRLSLRKLTKLETSVFAPTIDHKHVHCMLFTQSGCEPENVAISDALPLKTGRGDDIPQIKVRRSSNSDGIRQERTVATLSFAGGAA